VKYIRTIKKAGCRYFSASGLFDFDWLQWDEVFPDSNRFPGMTTQPFGSVANFKLWIEIQSFSQDFEGMPIHEYVFMRSKKVFFQHDLFQLEYPNCIRSEEYGS
jgi:hypothetical protein